MRLGLSSYAYRWSIGHDGYAPSTPLDVAGFVRKAVELGFDGVQICDNLPYQDLSRDQLTDIRQRLHERGMFLETGARGSAPEHLRAMLETASVLGAKLLRVVTVIDRSGSPDEIRRQLDQMVRDFRAVLPLARNLDIRLALENHANLSSADLLFVIQSVGDESLRVCLDTMNSLALLEHPLETVRKLAPQAITVHLKDFRVEKHPREFKVIGTALGDGMVDFQRILSLVADSGLDPTFHLELYIDHCQSDSQTLSWEDECVARSVQYARTHLNL